MIWFGNFTSVFEILFHAIWNTAAIHGLIMIWFGNFTSVFEISFFQDSVQFFYEFWIFLVIFIIFVIGKQMSFDSFIWIFVLLASFTFDFQIIYFENRAWRSFNPFDNTRSCNSKIGLLFIFVVILGFLKFSFRLFNFI